MVLSWGKRVAIGLSFLKQNLWSYGYDGRVGGEDRGIVIEVEMRFVKAARGDVPEGIVFALALMETLLWDGGGAEVVGVD